MIRVKSARLPFWGKKEKRILRICTARFCCRQPPRAAPSINLTVMRWAPRLHPQGRRTIWRSLWGFGQSSTVDWAAPLVFCYPHGSLPVKINQYLLLSSDKILPFLRLKRLGNTGQLCGSSPGSPLVLEAKLLIDYSDSAEQRALQ